MVVTGSRSCSDRLFLGVIRFSLLLKNPEHFQIPVGSEFDLCAHTLIKYLFRLFICLFNGVVICVGYAVSVEFISF